ncbi:hypothetical protein [Methylobacterium planeticum]|uniref:Uncharacterized protein n=1 Tax=Methylobacterium planeticum TaxID=2615211 RepID=A0A6N6MD36_9HYPH|nr:hypothetical protein [Methylobacterium planeticum]KAB1068557.1 hypothetical protein F6X51_26715 [Methylobacterium planeticum]
MNPVSGNAAVARMHDTIRSMVPDDPLRSRESETAQNVIRDSIARTVEGAVEAAGIVPTWIAVTAGVAGITSEIMPLTTAATLTALVATVSAMVLFFVFGRLDYYSLAEAPKSRWILARSKRQFMSSVILLANAIIILLAVWASMVPHSEGEHGGEATHPEPSATK